MIAHCKSEITQDAIVEEYIRFVHNAGKPAADSRKFIKRFRPVGKDDLSFDELVEIILKECLAAAGEGCTRLRFDLDYMETGNIDGTGANGSNDIDVDYFLPQEDNLVHIRWNRQNSPHLAAELATVFSRVYHMYMSFPFDGHKALYEIEMIEPSKAHDLAKAVTMNRGYEALKSGVPLEDILA